MWFDPIASWVVALFATGIPWLNEKTMRATPAENWANKELLHKDRMAGVSEKEILRRVEQGRYYIPKEIFEAYPVPHRTKNGTNKVIIENCELYNSDVSQYGAHQAMKWVNQGKYNLNAEELELANLKYERKHQYLSSLRSSDSRYAEKVREIDAILATKKWDCRNTEAVKQWQKAHDAETKYY